MRLYTGSIDKTGPLSIPYRLNLLPSGKSETPAVEGPQSDEEMISLLITRLMIDIIFLKIKCEIRLSAASAGDTHSTSSLRKPAGTGTGSAHSAKRAVLRKYIFSIPLDFYKFTF
jgi:hypothetical protein